EDGIRDKLVTGVQTCALPILVFHSVLLDPVAGSVKSERTWGNAGNSNALLPLESGSFLIQDGEWTKVYSPEMKELASKKWEVPRSEERRVGKECRARGAREH